jgi:hypothetical protein
MGTGRSDRAHPDKPSHLHQRRANKRFMAELRAKQLPVSRTTVVARPPAPPVVRLHTPAGVTGTPDPVTPAGSTHGRSPR